MNTGIGDTVDLGWKLAAMVEGWGGQNLLPSYDAERRPIGRRNVNMAAEFYLAHEEFTDGIAAIEDDSPAGADVRQRLGEALVRDVGAMFRTHGMQLGYRYENSPVCVADGSAPFPVSRALRSLDATGIARTACVARRGPLDARPLWTRICAASPWRRCFRRDGVRSRSG